MSLTKYEKLDSAATLNVRGVIFAQENPTMFAAVMGRLSFQMLAGTTITLNCGARRPDGSAEWGADIERDGRRVIYLGILQRTPQGEVEFHS